MNTRFKRIPIGIVSLIAVSPFAMAADNLALPSYFEEPGESTFRERNISLGMEQIDPFTGSLNLSYRDIVVPSNGGLDLVVTRTYRSMSNPNTTVPGHLGGRTTTGIGWDINFGRVWAGTTNISRTSSATACRPLDPTARTNPVFEMEDGSRQSLVSTDSANTSFGFITRNRWAAKCLTNEPNDPNDQEDGGLIVYSPDGIKYTANFRHRVSPGPIATSFAHHVTKIEHPDGTSISITYKPAASTTFATIDKVTHSDGHFLTFTYAGATTANSRLTQIKTSGSPSRTWKYNYTSAGLPNTYYLQSVTRPDNRDIDYTYYTGTADDGRYSLKTVTAPGGGKVTYSYKDDQLFPIRDGSFPTIVVEQKSTGGTVNNPGDWYYHYLPADSVGETIDKTVVRGPNECTVYTHRSGRVSGADGVSRIGNLLTKAIGPPSSTTNCINPESTTIYTWGMQQIAQQDYIRRRSAVFETGFKDSATFAPIATNITVVQDGKSYSTDFNNHDQYGNPMSVTEYNPQQSGALSSRTTNLTYYTNSTAWIINRVKNETMGSVRYNGADLATRTHRITRNYFNSGSRLGALQYERQGSSATNSTAYSQESYNYHTSGSSRGELKTVTDATSNVTTYLNYKRGSAQTVNRPENIVENNVINNLGFVTSQTDGEGDTVGYAYDDLDNVDFVYTARTDDTNIEVNYTYSPTAGIKRTVTRDEYSEIRTFDGFGNLEEVRVTSPEAIYVTYKYDENGRRTQVFNPNSGSRKKIIEYDTIDRVTKVRQPDNEEIRYAYLNNNIVERTNERGVKTKFFYRSFGDPSAKELIRIEAPEGATTVLTKNKLDQLLEVTKGGQSRKYVYDVRFYLDKEVHPEIGTIDYGRDAIGNMTSRKVGNSATTLYIYDDLHRLDSVNYFSPGSLDIDYEYYKDGLIKYAIKGPTTTRWDYQYDKNKNLKNETLKIGSQTYTLSYDYNDLDSLSSMTYPSGLTVDYSPDALGRPTKAGSFVTDIDYYKNGQVESMTFGNGVETSYGQDPDRLFPTSFVTTRSNSGDVLDFEYAYDDTGNVEQITDNRDSALTIDLTHDGLNRVKTASGIWGSGTIGYDPGTNNINFKNLGSQNLNFTTSSVNNRLTTITGAASYSFQYDDYGNVTSNGNNIFGYDESSHLRSITGGGDDIQYTYDANGRRVIEAKGSEVARHSVYGSNGARYYENETVGGMSVDFIYIDDKLVASRSQCDEPTRDTDGDGIPNCTEVAAGLNPNSAADGTQDIDGDGLTNFQEFQAGTYYYSNDTDNDGMFDGYEIDNGLNPLIDDADADLDGDGLPNRVESILGSMANNADTDGDGIGDYYEFFYGLQILSNDANGDLDGDGLSNLAEFNAGTDADNPDTDGDGLSDKYEVDNGLNPLVNDANADLDGDGLPNNVEAILGSMPNNPDTDGDGIGDYYEFFYGLQILSNDASGDLDGDGLSNLAEFNAGTDADNPDTDGDGLPDKYEVDNNLGATTSNATADADSDGLNNLDEFTAGTDPNDPDSDDDGTPDGSDNNPLLNEAVLVVIINHLLL